MNEIPKDRPARVIDPNPWLDVVAEKTVDFVFGDIVTLLDPDASEKERAFALAMMIPSFRLAKIPKLAEDIKDCIDLADEVKDTVDNVKDAAKGAAGSKFDEVFKLADNYKLSDDTFNNHILERHGADSLYSNKSHFNAEFDIKNGIDTTLKGDNFLVKLNTSGRDGYIFEQTFTKAIGVDSKGKPLNTIKVVIDEFGNVVTAFPKK